MKKVISGIQQIGIGVTNLKEAWKWYRKHFGMDINVFEDDSPAELMLPHTDGKPRPKVAALAMNMEGGGGFEIWNHTGITPKGPDFDVLLGDYGIYIAKLKSRDIKRAYETHRKNGLDILGELSKDPSGNLHYYVRDPYNNIFEIVNEPVVYKELKKPVNGGAYGAVIGVSDIEKSLTVYQDILNYDKIVYDKTDVFEDFAALPGGDKKVRRVLLKHTADRKGPFCKLLGPTQIELVQVFDREPRKIFENRIWGELGYIHLCFDIVGMDLLREEATSKGFPFTVDSANSFNMGVAAGHFTYIEDPDGTLIEFVETHKLPIIKSLGWYMKLKGRDPNRPLPTWMTNTMEWGRIKD